MSLSSKRRTVELGERLRLMNLTVGERVTVRVNGKDAFIGVWDGEKLVSDGQVLRAETTCIGEPYRHRWTLDHIEAEHDPFIVRRVEATCIYCGEHRDDLNLAPGEDIADEESGESMDLRALAPSVAKHVGLTVRLLPQRFDGVATFDQLVNRGSMEKLRDAVGRRQALRRAADAMPPPGYMPSFSCRSEESRRWSPSLHAH